MSKIQNFINGQWKEANTGKSIDKVSPVTGKVIYQMPDSDAVDVVQAVQAATKAFPAWSALTHYERSQFLSRIADRIQERAEEFALAETEDVGKPIELSRTLDIPRAVSNFRFFAGRLHHHEERSTEMDGKFLNYTLRQPIGVAGLISPWNLPLYLLTWKIAPALAMGNTVVCKPSELTPQTAFLLSEVMKEVELPPGVCNMVFGTGPSSGQPLVEHPGVPLISFTGGTATGEQISKSAAPFFKKLSLELGGKNSAIILKDADLKRAVLGTVRSSFLNQGEICLCTSRILVQEEIYEKFLADFSAEVDNLVVGDPLAKNTFMGPLISKAHFDKVQKVLHQAIDEKGKLTAGLGDTELGDQFKGGFFMRPKVIADLTQCSDVHQTEIFGPVVTIQSFKYPADAVKMANTTPYGLCATLWTQDISKAHKLAQNLQVGTVWINSWLQRDLRMPFGGQKASGLGREGGEHSFDFFSEQKTVCVQI